MERLNRHGGQRASCGLGILRKKRGFSAWLGPGDAVPPAWGLRGQIIPARHGAEEIAAHGAEAPTPPGRSSRVAGQREGERHVPCGGRGTGKPTVPLFMPGTRGVGGRRGCRGASPSHPLPPAGRRPGPDAGQKTAGRSAAKRSARRMLPVPGGGGGRGKPLPERPNVKSASPNGRRPARRKRDSLREDRGESLGSGGRPVSPPPEELCGITASC